MLQDCISGKFTQWMADNMDHNSVTLDGKGSLYAMGICSATVHSGKDSFKTLPLVKHQKRKSAYQVTHKKGIPVHEYTPSDESGLSKIFFKSMLQLKRPYSLPADTNLDILWHAAYFFTKVQRVRNLFFLHPLI